MFLGASIFTVLEFVEYFVRIIHKNIFFQSIIAKFEVRIVLLELYTIFEFPCFRDHHTCIFHKRKQSFLMLFFQAFHQKEEKNIDPIKNLDYTAILESINENHNGQAESES